MDKSILRKKYIGLRKQMNFKDVADQSASIMNRLLLSEAYQTAPCIFTYIGIKNEVETYALIERAFSDKKKIAVPKTFGNGIMKYYYIDTLNGLMLNSFGLLEPPQLEAEAIPDLQSIIIVPGVVFDQTLNRLGYGAGYFDRYLSIHTYNKAIALAFNFQVISNLPSEPWDIKMDALITQDQIYGQL